MKTKNSSIANEKREHTAFGPYEDTFRKQQALFSEGSLLPANFPSLHELRPAANLSALFDECHNYIYANEGLLKEKIFHEIVKLLAMKLYDEQNHGKNGLQFAITSSEYESILAGTPCTFEGRIRGLFEVVCRRFASLFSDDSLKLKPLTLAYVIGRLQYVSLTRTPGDVKGEAFQSFVYRHQRGDRGEFFTPHPIVKLAVEIIDPKPHEKVIDPACGSGGFLIQAISHICRKNPNTDKSAYVKDFVQGIEFNPDVALSAMIRLAFEGGTGTEILCANALLEKESFNNAFDIVLTNPPFGSKGKIEDKGILKSYFLAHRWTKISDDKWKVTRDPLTGQSPEILFIEKNLNLLRPGGRMAIVLPDGLLQNMSNSHVRFWIRSQAKVVAVVSVPQEAFVPYGTGIKTSLLFLQKLPSSADRVFMAQIRKIGYDVKRQPVYRRDDNGKFIKNLSGTKTVDDDIEEIAVAYNRFRGGERGFETQAMYAVPDAMLNTRLDVEHYRPEDSKLLEHLQASGAKPLGEIADILSETDDFRLSSDEDIRYIAISDVDSNTMQIVNQQIIRPHEAPSRATYRVRKGDIITAVSGASTGTQRHATALIAEDESGAICSNGFAVLRNIRKVEPLFLLAYTRTEYFLRQVRRLMTGHAIPAISSDDLARVLVPVPPVETQKKISKEIAAILSMRRESLSKSEKVIGDTESLISKLL